MPIEIEATLEREGYIEIKADYQTADALAMDLFSTLKVRGLVRALVKPELAKTGRTEVKYDVQGLPVKITVTEERQGLDIIEHIRFGQFNNGYQEASLQALSQVDIFLADWIARQTAQVTQSPSNPQV